MDRSIIIVFAIFLIIGLCLFINKYLFYPILFKPRLNSDDIFDFFGNKDYVLKAYSELSKSEKKELLNKGFEHQPFIQKFYTCSSDYKLILFSVPNQNYELFWVRVKQYALPLWLGKKQFNFIQETDSLVLGSIQNKYEVNNITVVKSKCPACLNLLNGDVSSCSNCGLNFL